MNLTTALTDHPAILAEFKRRATPETPSASLIAWLKQQPELAALNLHWPTVESFRVVRRIYGCPAARGGARAQRGEILYGVYKRDRREAV